MSTIGCDSVGEVFWCRWILVAPWGASDLLQVAASLNTHYFQTFGQILTLAGIDGQFCDIFGYLGMRVNLHIILLSPPPTALTHLLISLGSKRGLKFDGEEDGILTSLDGVKELGVMSNDALDQGPSSHTRGTNQHLSTVHTLLSLRDEQIST